MSEREISAVRTLESKGFKYAGGKYWKPPVGMEPDWDNGRWRPIETAPVDGTTVLVWNGYCGVYASRFLAGEWAHASLNYSKIAGFDVGLNFPVPSYWMPLPASPQAANYGGGL